MTARADSGQFSPDGSLSRVHPGSLPPAKGQSLDNSLVSQHSKLVSPYAADITSVRQDLTQPDSRRAHAGVGNTYEHDYTHSLTHQSYTSHDCDMDRPRRPSFPSATRFPQRKLTVRPQWTFAMLVSWYRGVHAARNTIEGVPI
jgi:hypothetical protein